MPCFVLFVSTCFCVYVLLFFTMYIPLDVRIMKKNCCGGSSNVVDLLKYVLLTSSNLPCQFC